MSFIARGAVGPQPFVNLPQKFVCNATLLRGGKPAICLESFQSGESDVNAFARSPGECAAQYHPNFAGRRSYPSLQPALS